MAKKNIRVELQTGSPDSMIGLSEAITEQHESYSTPGTTPVPGEESPLDRLDMNGFKTTTLCAKDTLKESRKLHSHGEGLTLKAYTIMGFAEGQTIQTPGTLYYDADVIRGILLGEHKEDEEAMEDYGFNVLMGQTNGRTDISTEIPVKRPIEFLDLCESIVEQHELLGAESPLRELDMAGFKEKTIQARSSLKNARKHHKKAQKLTLRALSLIGIAKGQTSRTKGTLYYTIDIIRGILLKKFKGSEEDLEEWGFTVVITESQPGKKTKRIEVIIPKGASVTIINVADRKNAKNIGKTILAYRDSASDEPIAIQPGEEILIQSPSGSIIITNRSAEKTGRIKLDTTK